MFRLFLSNKIKNKKYAFIIYNLIAILVFSLIYWICDTFLDDGTNIHEEKNVNTNNYGNLLYWFWFSVMTQSTVGYMFFNHSFYGKRSMKLDLFKYINILQCFSIFIINAQLL